MGLMPDFFMRNRKKIRMGGGGVIPKFLVCTQRILLGVWGGGGGWLMPDFFMCN